MGKRLTPEEREARIKAYEEAKAARQAARLEKRKARAEAYEKAKNAKERVKKGPRPVELNDSDIGKPGQVRRFPTWKGSVELGDRVGFRWLCMAMEGTVEEIKREDNWRVYDDDNAVEVTEDNNRSSKTFVIYMIRDRADKDLYPIKRCDILAKNINGVWVDNYNYSKYIHG